MIVTLKTDNPVAEIGLFTADSTKISYFTWRADRQLAKDLLRMLHEQLIAQQTDWSGLTGLVVYEGPGSFTGLRIGITVANTLAYGQDVPLAGARGETWITDGIAMLAVGDTVPQVLPFYGAEATITKPRK